MKITIFDKSSPNISKGIITDADFNPSANLDFFPDQTLRKAPLGLPEVSEVEAVRHFTNLSHENYGVDNSTYPLGSCTMKYNPKRNDAASEISGFRDLHPCQPVDTMNGLWEMMYNLQSYFAEILGMDHINLQPAAGAHGELAGLMVIRKYFEKQNQKRNIILIPDSAHGTNPASAAMVGFTCNIIPTGKNGLIDFAAFKKMVNKDVAAIMLTNPSTLGLFEEDIIEITKILHDNGSLLYYDGANLNALMGNIRPGDMGFDVVHINTHKTFSTPHGGGGPGAGPVGVKEFLKDYLPVPTIKKDGDKYYPTNDVKDSIGRIKTGFGHIDVLIRAYSYIRTMGPDGLKQASEDAVLNANYLQAVLSDVMHPVFNTSYPMHECLLTMHKDVLISAYNFAKRLIDYGVHPPTLLGAGCVYFSDDLASAMLIEPTETETKENLDRIAEIFRIVIHESINDSQMVDNAPYSKSVSKILPSKKLTIIE